MSWLLVSPFHGDLSVRIAEKTELIRTDPKNWLLYMQRGELHFQHEQPDSALLDYQIALENHIDTSVIHVLTAEAFLALGDFNAGLDQIDLFLELEPADLKGIHTRGKLLEASGRFTEAATDFEHVIGHTTESRPQDHVQLADLYLKMDGDDFDRAIRTLERGIQQIGEIVSLQMKIYELEKQRRNYAAAHVLLDRMMEPLSRKERLMVEKAELFAAEGKPMEAAQLLLDAESAISALPIRFQNIGATVKLKEKIEHLKQKI